MSLATKERLAQLVVLYGKRFNGGGPPMQGAGAMSDEQLIQLIEQALKSGAEIPGWEFENRFDLSLLRQRDARIKGAPKAPAAPSMPGEQSPNRHLSMSDVTSSNEGYGKMEQDFARKHRPSPTDQ